MGGERRITDQNGRKWTVTTSVRYSDRPYFERVRSGRGGVYFRSGSECREAFIAVSDLGQLTDSELLALLWGAESVEPEEATGNAWKRLFRILKREAHAGNGVHPNGGSNGSSA